MKYISDEIDNASEMKIDIDPVDYRFDFDQDSLTNFVIPPNCNEIEMSHVNESIWSQIKNTIPRSVKSITFLKSKLASLIVPDGIEWVHATLMELEHVVLPDSIILASLRWNLLRHVHVPPKTEFLNLEGNILKSITGSFTNLDYLNIEGNRIQHLDFAPPITKEIDIVCDPHVVISDRVKAAMCRAVAP